MKYEDLTTIIWSYLWKANVEKRTLPRYYQTVLKSILIEPLITETFWLN